MTEEKIIDNEKFSEEVLDDEELEQVAGGTLTPNRYGIKNYKRAHIKVVKHFFAKNEFWWKGQDIGHDNANAITFFYNKTRKHAGTLEEALQFRDDHYWEYHGEIPACFIGNSKISTPNGEKFIKDIKIGDEVISLDAENKKIVSKVIEVRPVFENEIVKVEFSNGKIHLAVDINTDKDLVARLKHFLEAETAQHWQVDIDYEPLGETLADKERQKISGDKKNISEYPLVRAILSEFNGARIETIIRRAVDEADENEMVDFSAPEIVYDNDEEE